MAKRDKTYIRPMLEVYQMLDDTVGVVGEHLTACVIGPQYDLYRYGYDDEELHPMVYSAGGQFLPFEYSQDPGLDYSVDQAFANLYGEDLEAEMYSGNGFSSTYSDSEGNTRTKWEIKSGLSAFNTQYNFTVTAEAPYFTTLRLGKGTQTYSGTNYDIQGLFACRDHDKLDDLKACLLTGEKGYCVEEADVILVTDTDGITRSAVIKEVLGTPIPAEVTPGVVFGAEREAGEKCLLCEKASDGSDTSDLNTDMVDCNHDKYDGRTNTTVVVTILSVDTETKQIGIRINDTEGLGYVKKDVVDLSDSSAEGGIKDSVTIPGPLAVDITFKKALFTSDASTAGTLKAGDSFTFIAQAESASTTEFNGVELTSLPVNIAKMMSKKEADKDYGIKDIRITKVFTDDIPRNFYNVDATGITTTENIYLAVTQTLHGKSRTYVVPFTDGRGLLYPCFRVLVIPGHDEDVFEIDELSDITRYFGVIDQDNLLAYGCYRAFMGAAKRMIYAVRTRGTGKDEFYEAVKKTESNRATYSFCPLTNEYEVAEVVADFNDEMSEPDVKRWRRTIVGIEGAGQYLIASVARSKDTHNMEKIKATFSSVAADDNFVMVQVDNDLDFDFREIAVNDMLTNVKRGDLIRVAATGDYFKVKEVLTDKTLILQSGPSTQISVSVPIEVYKAVTPENNVEYLGLTANSFKNRRVLLVWTDHGVLADNDLAIPVANMFLAAEIAGLSSAVLPQASITHTEITGITAASRMYTQYSQKQLDEIASYGVLVITQDAKDEPCYIRHQLTTDMAHGALYREDSCTRNLDNISYAMVDILEKYIGHANVTPTALAAIRDDVTARLNEFTTDGTDPMIGPSLVSWDNLRIKQDKIFKDRVNVWVDLYLPLPLNNIRLYEMAYAATVEI